MKDIYIENIEIGQILIKDNIKYIVIEKEINGDDDYYSYLTLIELNMFCKHNPIRFDKIEKLNPIYTCNLSDFTIAEQKYNIIKSYEVII